LQGEHPLADEQRRRRCWGPLIVTPAVALFMWLAIGAERPSIAVNGLWMAR
jgi:hypothetical protein